MSKCLTQRVYSSFHASIRLCIRLSLYVPKFGAAMYSVMNQIIIFL